MVALAETGVLCGRGLLRLGRLHVERGLEPDLRVSLSGGIQMNCYGNFFSGAFHPLIVCRSR